MIKFFSSRPYSLNKSRNILKWAYGWYKKHGNTLSPAQLAKLEADMESLDKSIREKDRKEANRLAREIEQYGNTLFKKSVFSYAAELFVAIVFALIIATLVRQMWFELYEIPTGSMRPTFKEQDHLTVTKTAFGINFPLETKHLYFDPTLVQRSSIFIFSADGLPMRDVDTTYFWVLPYKKRLIKRCMGKPGDLLYFYGGQIYGVDKDGNPLNELRTSPWMENLEYIPFLSFEGEISNPKYNEIVFSQMHEAVGRLTLAGMGEINGQVFNGKEWVKDRPSALKKEHDEIQTYSDLWGMRNYAMARLLTKKQVQELEDIKVSELEESELYLELRHTPSLTYPKPLFLREGNGMGVFLNPYRTVIPLQEKHLNAIMDHMYTARFTVSDGYAKLYSIENHPNALGVEFLGIPNGTYELYYGKAYKVGWGGITKLLPSSHPLYKHDPSHIQKLYNLGMEMSSAYEPYASNKIFFPHRYAYFRDGDLYLLGAPIFKKDDPTLISFNQKEQKREQQSSGQNSYIAFKDYGPPLKEGQINKEFLKSFGLKVPDKHYLALGDNHAKSGDSRVFGFVPQANLQGAPSLIIWPPGDRLGPPPQKPYPIFNIPRTIIWMTVLIILGIWYAIHRINLRKPIFKKIEFGKQV